MNHTVTLSEGQRQMMLLALAQLVVERPGWDYLAREVAELLHGEDMYEQFKALHEPGHDCPALPPKEEVKMKRAIIFGGLEAVSKNLLDRQVDHAKLCKVIDVDSEEAAQGQVVECLEGLGLSPGQYARVPGTTAWAHVSVDLAERADLITRYAIRP